MTELRREKYFMQCNPNLMSCCSAIYEGSALPKIVKLNCVTSLCTAGQPYALQNYRQGKQLVAKVGESALK